MLIFFAVVCVILGIVSYLRSPSYEERLLLERQREFFAFADSVFADMRGFKTSSPQREGFQDKDVDNLNHWGCQLYGRQGITLESPDGAMFEVWLSKLVVLSWRLERNQKYRAPIYPIHFPYTDLNEFWNGEFFSRASANDVLQMDVGSTTIPVQYVQWPMPRGTFLQGYFAWLADGSWILPITRGDKKSYRVPHLPQDALENGWGVLRVYIKPINAVGDQPVPTSSIKAILEQVVKKMPQLRSSTP